MLFFQQKKSPFFFISRSGFLSVFFSLSFTGLSPIFSFSLSFSLSIFQTCGHEIINLSLILNTTRIQKQFPLSVFVFIDSLVVSASQDKVAMRFPTIILLHKKLLQFDWLIAVVFQLNLKYLLVKITKPLRVVV